MAGIDVVRSVAGLRRAVTSWREAGDKIALVPTMGALHQGHLSLIRLARRKAKRVIVSIFVNPAQFGPNEDFAKYPRTFAEDRRKVCTAGADLIYAPDVPQMYPDGFALEIVPKGAALAGLEDTFRPTHFSGVATIVAKLLTQTAPDVAVFGEKDYQQLQVVTRLAQDLDLPVRIIGGVTEREKDGLALSSRNRYLSPEERAVAPALYRALTSCADEIVGGAPLDKALAKARQDVVAAGFTLDYLEARHARTLTPVSSRQDGPLRLLVAARIGSTRLIDNIAV